jgi:hypothetical protein
LSYLKEIDEYEADLVVQLRPTYPIRSIEDIDNMIEKLIEHKEWDSIRSVAPAKEIPYKMWHQEEDGTITPIITDIPECYNIPRQHLPNVYYQNACIDVVRGSVILEQNSMSGKVIGGYVMDKNYDIDTEEEFQKAEDYIKMKAGNKRFVFDIDGVIAKLEKNNDYALAEPDVDMIAVINKLYAMGNYIVLLTARGYVTGIDWSEITKEQLKKWGLVYHELHFGKPNADYYVDDKMIDRNKLLDFIF